MKRVFIIYLVLAVIGCSKDKADTFCHNGILDGDETGVDCGGSCVSCMNGSNWSGGGEFYFTGHVYDSLTGLPVSDAIVFLQEGPSDSTDVDGSYFINYWWLGTDGYIVEWYPSEFEITAQTATLIGDSLISSSPLSSGDTVTVDIYIN